MDHELGYNHEGRNACFLNLKSKLKLGKSSSDKKNARSEFSIPALRSRESILLGFDLQNIQWGQHAWGQNLLIYIIGHIRNYPIKQALWSKWPTKNSAFRCKRRYAGPHRRDATIRRESTSLMWFLAYTMGKTSLWVLTDVASTGRSGFVYWMASWKIRIASSAYKLHFYSNASVSSCVRWSAKDAVFLDDNHRNCQFTRSVFDFKRECLSRIARNYDFDLLTPTTTSSTI